MNAVADCEKIGLGFIGQPVNSLSTIGFVAFGLWLVWKRPRSRWIGFSLVATGVGSFVFHGPMPAGSEWWHDTSLAWLLTVVAGEGTRGEKASRLPGLAILGGVFALAPGSADPIAVVLTIVAVVVRLRRDRSWATVGPLLLAGAAGLYGRLGATGGPLCDPSSMWQPHAVWHVAAAIAVAWLAGRNAL